MVGRPFGKPPDELDRGGRIESVRLAKRNPGRPGRVEDVEIQVDMKMTGPSIAKALGDESSKTGWPML